MKKILDLDTLPTLVSVAAFGSAVTACFLLRLDAQYMPALLCLPLLGFAMDQYFKSLTYQQNESIADLDFFSFIPRLGFSLIVLTAYIYRLLLALPVKDWELIHLYLKLVILVYSLCIIAMGSTMGRLKFQNIRGNPSWLKSSKLAFKKTNRLLGWFFILTGTAFAPLGLWSPDFALFFMVCLIAIGSFGITYGYSYYVWKHDPDREEV